MLSEFSREREGKKERSCRMLKTERERAKKKV